MSAPKLTRILNTLAARLALINGTGTYATEIGCDVRRSRLQPTDSDVPCCLVYLDGREADSTDAHGRSVCRQVVIVEGYVSRVAFTEESQGVGVIADIQTAIESDSDQTLGRLLSNAQGGMKFARDEVLYPQNGENVVGGRVEYDIPHMRQWGDPEIA